MLGDPWNEVAPGLWMGGGRKTPTLADFDAVVTVAAPVVPCSAEFVPGDGRRMDWFIPDLDAAPGPNLDHLGRVVDYTLGKWRDGARVLVRCEMGWNRSGLVVGATLVAAGWSGADAVAAIRKARGGLALSNRTFASVVDVTRPARVVRPRDDDRRAAGILLVHRASDGNRYLLLRRTIDKCWGTPGGLCHVGESEWDAARRETEEETGIVLRDDQHSERDYTCPFGGGTSRNGPAYTTHVVTVDRDLDVTLDHEHTDHRWVTRDEAAAMMLHPQMAQSWGDLTDDHRMTTAVQRVVAHDAPILAWRVDSVTQDLTDLRGIAAQCERDGVDLHSALPLTFRSPWGGNRLGWSGDPWRAPCACRDPWNRCYCGIHAWTRTELLEAAAVDMRFLLPAGFVGERCSVAGYVGRAVLLSGTVSEDRWHAGAIRADHAVAVGPIWGLDIGDPDLHRVGARYGIETRRGDADDRNAWAAMMAPRRDTAAQPTPVG